MIDSEGRGLAVLFASAFTRYDSSNPEVDALTEPVDVEIFVAALIAPVDGMS